MADCNLRHVYKEDELSGKKSAVTGTKPGKDYDADLRI